MTNRTPKNFTVKENLLLIAISLTASMASAQNPPVNEPDYNKPALFAELPDTLRLPEAELQALFGRQPGEMAQLKMSASFQFAGTIMGKTNLPGPDRVSMVLRSTNKPGAYLCLTRITLPGGNTEFRGRIISRAHIDCYDLVYRPETGYQFLKKNYYTLVSE